MTLLFQEYDEKKPKAAETLNVISNFLNFLAAIAGDRIRTGPTGDIIGIYGQAE